jgi:hypothetical protein
MAWKLIMNKNYEAIPTGCFEGAGDNGCEWPECRCDLKTLEEDYDAKKARIIDRVIANNAITDLGKLDDIVDEIMQGNGTATDDLSNDVDDAIQDEEADITIEDFNEGTEDTKGPETETDRFQRAVKIWNIITDAKKDELRQNALSLPGVKEYDEHNQLSEGFLAALVDECINFAEANATIYPSLSKPHGHKNFTAGAFTDKPLGKNKREETSEEKSDRAMEIWKLLSSEERKEILAEVEKANPGVTPANLVPLIRDAYIKFAEKRPNEFSGLHLPHFMRKGEDKGKSGGYGAWKDCHKGPVKVYTIGKCNIWAAREADVHLSGYPDWTLRIICCGSAPQPVAVASSEAKALLGDAGDSGSFTPWVHIDWPDYGVPKLSKYYWEPLAEALAKLEGDVCINCVGGHGRTGTAISILASLHNVVPEDDCPIGWLRKRYCAEVVESDVQVKYIEKMTGRDCPSGIRDSKYSYVDYSSYGKHSVGAASAGTVTMHEKKAPSYLKPAPKVPNAQGVLSFKQETEAERAARMGVTVDQMHLIDAARKRRKEERKAAKAAKSARKAPKTVKKPRRGRGSY